jgi:hypothetical protein
MNDDDDLPPDFAEPFTIPLPPPPPPGADVFFYRHAGHGPGRGIAGMRGMPGMPGYPPEGAGGRDAEDIMLRRVPSAIAMKFRAAAGGRGMTHAQYLAALVGLHEAIRASADAGDKELAAELEKLGLQTVSI